MLVFPWYTPNLITSSVQLDLLQWPNSIVMTVVEDLSIYASPQIPPSIFQAAQDKVKDHGQELLNYYGNLAEKAGVFCLLWFTDFFQVKNHTLLLAVSNHVGEMLCQAVERKKIDFLIIGRRGMSKVKRFLINVLCWLQLFRFVTGSNSRYVTEHANCSVLVVKGEHNLVKEQKSEETREAP